MTIGLISDTHGLLRPEAMKKLQGVDLIVHGGDVGKGEILERLEEIAPVHAVRGNIDREGRPGNLPIDLRLEVGGIKLYVIHIIKEMKIDPAAEGMDLVVFGHSHKPTQFEKDGVIYVNPGSAGRRRFSLPIGLALVHVREARPVVEFVELIG